MPSSSNTLIQIKSLAQSGLFESVTPNHVGQLTTFPNEVNNGDFHLQWYLRNVGQPPTYGSDDADVDATEGWSHNYGEGTTTLIMLDSGLPITNGELSHPELDDPQKFLFGVDYINDTDPFRDIYGHGTLMTGIAAGETNNSIGIAGVNWSCYAIMYKIADNQGFVDEGDVSAAIQHAISNPDRTPYCVINCPFSLTSDYPVVRQAIVAAGEADILIVAGTGNNSYNNWVGYPARYSTEYDNVIAVAATNRNDYRSPYSNGGPQVTVSAPGGNQAVEEVRGIYSTAPGYQITLPGFGTDQYGYIQGTSPAGTITSGLASLVMATNPSLLPIEIKNLIIQGVDKIHPETYTYDQNGHNNEVGYGRVNIYNTLLLVPVTGLWAHLEFLEELPLSKVSGGIQPMGGLWNHQVRLRWDPHNGRERHYYRVDRREDPSYEWAFRGYFTTTTYTDRGVKDGKTYYYRIYPNDIMMDDVYQPSETIEVYIPYGGPIERSQGDEPAVTGDESPEDLELKPNYPNPFNPSTQIKFGLPAATHVRLQIMNIRGQTVRVLVDEEKPAGWFTVTWDGKNESGREVASGIYLYLIEADNKKILKKLSLIR